MQTRCLAAAALVPSHRVTAHDRPSNVKKKGRAITCGRPRRPSGDERYASKQHYHVNHVNFDISKTPKIIVWVQSGPELCAHDS